MTKRGICPVVMDIEASGFGAKGYPIEVGFVDESGFAHCFLIEPERHWTYWNDEIESIHGITRQILKDYGRPAIEVANYLNGVLKGKTVYSDAWAFDLSWIGKMFDTVDRVQLFELKSLMDLLDQSQMEQWDTVKSQVISELDIQRHRASSDARIIQETFRRVMKSDPCNSLR